MSTTAMHPLAVDYLRQLRQAGRELPAGRLDDLCAELESHLAEAIPADASDAEARSVIERLGPPEEIVEAEQPAAPAASTHGAPPDGDPRTWHEWSAIILLLFGGFAFGVGWIAGVVLLWTSRAWTTRDKLIGTLIVPGGLAGAAVFVLGVGVSSSTQSCSGTATEVSPQFIPGHMHCFQTGGSSTPHLILGIALLLVVVVGPILVAIHLARSASSSPRAI